MYFSTMTLNICESLYDINFDNTKTNIKNFTLVIGIMELQLLHNLKRILHQLVYGCVRILIFFEF